ncbi:Ribokinase [Auxenochlorella protothecoides]|uniref:Ribokinase n=1 Tax=Auxenochlorella protothecoides TaxID=3075 RepID=A0A087SU94_AUXPR|nr:Ribokinase [Auxenochlorella protothecoides]KFM29298.1 Ribokinase [Auxenochlorella protothecoides]
MYADTRKPLVVAGSINADLVAKVARLPAPGETMESQGFDVFPGGKVGTDAYAGMLRSSLSDCGVDTSLVTSADGSSGMALILLQPGGENSIILVGGANTSDNWKITDEATQARRRAVQTAGALLLQREIPEVFNVIFAKIAASAGVPVILDAGGVTQPIQVDLLSNVSLVSPNETELARLTNMPTKTMAQVQAAAEALVHSGVNKVLVKLGSKGSMLVDIYGNVLKQKAVPVSDVVDTTGAGDCFTAAFAVAMLEGKNDAEAMSYASAAASVCIGRAGALPSLPTRQEVEAVLSRQLATATLAAAEDAPSPRAGAFW